MIPKSVYDNLAASAAALQSLFREHPVAPETLPQRVVRVCLIIGIGWGAWNALYWYSPPCPPLCLSSELQRAHSEEYRLRAFWETAEPVSLPTVAVAEVDSVSAAQAFLSAGWLWLGNTAAELENAAQEYVSTLSEATRTRATPGGNVIDTAPEPLATSSPAPTPVPATLTPESPADIQVSGTQTVTLTEPAICWGERINGYGSEGNPVVVAISAVPTDVAIRSGGCRHDATLQQVTAELQRRDTLLHWQVVTNGAKIKNIAVARVWELRDAWHTAESGDICWGTGFGSLEDRYGVNGAALIVQFASADIPRYIEYGTCERNGRSLEQIQRTLERDQPEQHWRLVENLAEVRGVSPPIARRWYSSGTAQTTVGAQSVCWGTRVNGYGAPGNPVIFGIPTEMTVTVESGGCLTGMTDLAALATNLQAESPFLHWQVVPDIQNAAAFAFAKRTEYSNTTAALEPGTVCYSVGVRVDRTDYGSASVGFVFRIETPRDVRFGWGMCEVGGRSYEQLLQSQREYEPNTQWIDIGSFEQLVVNAEVPTRWQSGQETASYTARAGSYCWGSTVAGLHPASNRVLVLFREQWNAIAVTNGMCEANHRSWEDAIRFVKQEVGTDDPATPDDDWWIVDDYAVYGR